MSCPDLFRKCCNIEKTVYPTLCTAPKDRFHLIYMCMLIAGIGFLIPWVSYIGAIDYFFYYYLQEFPSVSIIIAIVYFATSFIGCSLNLALVKVLGTHSRILSNYVMFVIGLLTVPLLDIAIHNCVISTGVSFYITLLSLGVVGLASGSEYYHCKAV
jgi:hypothetical protein